ncbi:PilZ domain-containing protein [Methylobacterium sp. J-076]|uniref:PilZ domain-containing protein n=1 Tax=Methylobacterium sp. J-076 TaxID=2836655 RepID=UPI001FBA7687|nr:PilZ domain-containing protein [Methylobacterium sp. J-076]MCJ2014405.1 pilus assembly protein PilZ [Methylobacterium sp. J-076]
MSPEPPDGRAGPPIHVDGRVAVAGGPEAFCRARIGGPDAILIVTAAGGRRGQRALCRLDRIGVIPGRVGAPGEAGFALIPDLCDVRRERIRARLAWLVSREAARGDQRGTPRIVPVHRAVTVRLSDGRNAQGEIDDLSKSGARIRLPADAGPSHAWLAGMPVTVGKRYAVLVRAEDGVIAVRFRLPFTDETFNPSVVL